MPGIVHPNKNINPWILYIKRNIERNKNHLIFISGDTGSGKSYVSLKIAEDLDDDFNIDRVVFSARDLLKVIKNTKLKPGSVIVWEEAGIDFSHRSWQSETNKLMVFLLETFRKKRLILILNSPFIEFIDKSGRKMFHANLITSGIDYRNKTVTIKPYRIEVSKYTGKVYYKYLKMTIPKRSKIKRWSVAMPSKEIIATYEPKKDDFLTALLGEIESKLDKKHTEDKTWNCVVCGHNWLSRNKNNPPYCPKLGCRSTDLICLTKPPNRAKSLGNEVLKPKSEFNEITSAPNKF